LTKEIHYFDDHYDRWHRSYPGFFPPAASSAARPVVTGEASPGYAFHPHAVDRIARDLPSVRLVFLVRDPVDRAYSQYQHERRLGYEDAPTFAEALDREDARIEPELARLHADPSYVSFSWRHHSYRHRGHYLEQIVRAENAVGRDRLLVVNSDDLFQDAIATVARVVRFLELQPWEPRAVGPNDMAAGPCSPIDPGLERELRAYFRPHNEALAGHLDWDLGWDR
jgi:hypothetical protein